jgi:hypothetical protein
LRRIREAVASANRQRERERAHTQKARGNYIHLRRFELLRLEARLQGLNTPKILKLPEVFLEVLRQIYLLFTYGTSRTAIFGIYYFYSLYVKNIELTKV